MATDDQRKQLSQHVGTEDVDAASQDSFPASDPPSSGAVRTGGPWRPAAEGHVFHPTVVREYDIRGIVGDTLTDLDAHAIGSAFGRMAMEAGARQIVVGYDGRHSSPAFEQALVDGLLDSGADAVRIGRGPTPMMYFAGHHLGVGAGIMITGSHNPPDHNGFKLVLGHRPVFGAQLRKLAEIAARAPASLTRGRASQVSVFDAYVDRLAQDYDGERPLAVAWDAGNGATGEVLAALVRRLPGRHILLNETIDGDFPAHHPDPTVAKNLVQLQDAIRAQGCDFGVGFDGDGDRLGIVDGQGRILWGDQLTALMARDILGRNPGSTIVADVKSSEALFDDIARHGGVPLMWKSGHSLLKDKLAETGAPFGGELSGHVFIADRFYGHDDALYAAVRFLGLASRAEQSVAAMRDSLPAMVNTPELRFPCDDEVKFDAVERVKRNLRAAGADVTDIDGVRVRTPEGWWLLRASNTQAMLVARCEAATAPALERVVAQLLAALKAVEIEAPQI
jgi:phosphomannomutase